MRGRTLNNALSFFDESHNFNTYTREQMKCFLTRNGFGSTAVINWWHYTIRFTRGTTLWSGSSHARLKGVSGISMTMGCSPMSFDILSQRIVEALGWFWYWKKRQRKKCATQASPWLTQSRALFKRTVFRWKIWTLKIDLQICQEATQALPERSRIPVLGRKSLTER